MLPRLFALLCIVAHAAHVSADQNVTDTAGACEGEPSALVQLAAKATSNSTGGSSNRVLGSDSRRRRSRRRAGTYTGTIPYKVQVGSCPKVWPDVHKGSTGSTEVAYENHNGNPHKPPVLVGHCRTL